MSVLRILAVTGLLFALTACQDSGLDLAARSGRKVVVGPSVPVAIESFEGAPQDVAPRFSAALAAEAQSREVSFVDAAQAPRFRMRGYLTAAPGEGGTVVSYVWDLFDQGRRRAQRVSGTELIKRSAGDPWSVVDEAALKRIAARCMDEIAAFLAGVAQPDAPTAAAPTQNLAASR